MTRQEITRGIADLINLDVSDEIKHRIAVAITRYLHSEDVVIKIDRELPPSRLPNSEIDSYIWEAQIDMLKWHNDSFESLIEE